MVYIVNIDTVKDYYTLTTKETKEEIAKGLAILKEADIQQPKVFIPPAWHISPSTAEALHDMGFDVSESLDKIDLIQRHCDSNATGNELGYIW
jgi:predicted deacetylase